MPWRHTSQGKSLYQAGGNILLTSVVCEEYNGRMYSIRTEWGRRLREVRGERSQQEMAALVGIPQASWSKLERGKVGVSDELKVQIARRAGVLTSVLWAWPEGTDDE